MGNRNAYWEHVNLKFQVFNGLFLGLPFENLRRAGILLPMFGDFARQRLAENVAPRALVDEFLGDHAAEESDEERTDLLFRFVQLVERQVLLFDALEDSAFAKIHDMEGAGSLQETLERIVQSERRADLKAITERFRVRIVLTAHPTQFYPSAVLGILNDLGDALRANDVARIHELLLQLGKTRFRNRSKPTPYDEAQSLLWYLERVFFQVVPDIHERYARAAADSVEAAMEIPAVIELGFWPGGDRDGNPFVNADTTRAVAEMLRTSILRLYRGRVQALARRLTFDGADTRVAAIAARLDRSIDEPESSDAYSGAEELIADAMDLWHHLQNHHGGLFAHLVEELVFAIRAFGVHFATLDMRQDSRVHAQALDFLLPGYHGKSIQERFAQLEQLLAQNSVAEVAALFDIDDLADIPGSLRAGAMIQARGGERALHRYIISNTQSPANVLEALFLARCAVYHEGRVPLDIVPLFETVDDLGNAEDTMRSLFESPQYRAHLRSRGDSQTIMLGFSDGTKDGGYVTANWLIYQAKRALSAVAGEYGVRVVYFEGRGGPPARGGGNTHQFYRALPSDVDRDEIHLTIQGQTISSNYGTSESARYNLEQLVTAGLENLLLPEDFPDLGEEQISLLDRLSDLSHAQYLQLKAAPSFMDYLQDATPLTYYGEANNASRPTSRKPGARLQLQDLRAIPFVGAWSQMKQNVPGYYGFGTALRRLIDDGRLSELRAVYQKYLFFRTLVENSMQSLAKANFDLTAYIPEALSEYASIWHDLHGEAQRTAEALTQVAGGDELLAAAPATRASIALRERIVLPALVIQQYALQRVREDASETPATAAMRKLVVRGMAAIVNAGRNSV